MAFGLDSQHLPILLATLVMLVALYCTFAKVNELKTSVDRQLKGPQAQEQPPAAAEKQEGPQVQPGVAEIDLAAGASGDPPLPA